MDAKSCPSDANNITTNCGTCTKECGMYKPINSEKVGLKRDTSFSGVASSGRFKLAWDASILSAL